MKRTLLTQLPCDIPEEYQPLLQGATLYDSSSSPAAKVIYIEKGDGYFLKSAAKDSLKQEAEMTRFFHQKQLATEVLSYISDDKDWLLTRQVLGEDCIHPDYLADPKRLCDILAELLWKLHHTDHSACPVPDHTSRYIATARKNYLSGQTKPSAYLKRGFHSADEAWSIVEKHAHMLKSDTLLHGDYCLPNIILNNWKFSAFIDVDNGGVGDKHVDLYWALWSLNYNLKTDHYGNRFLDAYGRQAVEIDMLKIIHAIEVFG